MYQTLSDLYRHLNSRRNDSNGNLLWLATLGPHEPRCETDKVVKFHDRGRSPPQTCRRRCHRLDHSYVINSKCSQRLSSRALVILRSVVFGMPLECIILRQHFQSSVCCCTFRSHLNCHTIHKSQGSGYHTAIVVVPPLALHSYAANCSTPQQPAPVTTL